jgi:hypothetical protein
MYHVDIGLASPNIASSAPLPSTPLRFLSTVDTAKIPLYLAAGPSLDVWTTSEATEAWFESMLLSQPVLSTDIDATEHEWWNLARSQSPIGILVQVQSRVETVQKPSVTEILFYGTIALSSAGPPAPQHDQLPELRVHAIPLSSDLLYHEAATDKPALSPACPTTDADAQFLSTSLNTCPTPESPKRKRDLFEEATIANKKARGKGGVGISAAAARGSESQPTLGHRKSISFDTDARPPSANGALPRPAPRPLSRSPSISSDARPLSRKGVLESSNKRSNLSQVATVSLQLEEEPTTSSRNKEALSRVVMAALRMHGLQQRKKNRSRRESIAPGAEDGRDVDAETAAEDAAKDEEYKGMYHQTYKGAAFAFVSHRYSNCR